MKTDVMPAALTLDTLFADHPKYESVQEPNLDLKMPVVDLEADFSDSNIYCQTTERLAVRLQNELGSHFNREIRELQTKIDNRRILVVGQLSGYYVKQLLQKAIRSIRLNVEVVDQVGVSP